MNRDQIQSAIDRHTPFIIRMADGKTYPVPHADFLSLPPKQLGSSSNYCIVYDQQARFHVLPLLTMTGLTFDASDTRAA